MINLYVGRKFDQPIEDAYQLNFSYKVAATTADYLQVQLSAAEGPLGTKDYRIQVEAVPVDAGRSVIHMSYAYGYGFAAKMATQTYLATIGSQKVGFTVVGKDADGKPVYQRGRARPARAQHDALLPRDRRLPVAYNLPAAEQPERRIREWFASTERYARQLHEMDRDEYLQMKRNEMRRQQQG